MYFTKLFDKYYKQISSALLPDYKKAIGKIYLKDIQPAIEVIDESEFQIAIDKSQDLLKLFQEQYKVNFKPIALPKESIKDTIKAEIEPEWSGFFKTLTVLIDNHDFYKIIESCFQRYYEGIVKAAEVLAKDLKLIADVQKISIEAKYVGKSREKLIQNLHYLATKSQQLFSQYYTQISTLRNDVDNYSQDTIKKLIQAKQDLSAQVEKIISEEQSIQSEYQKFFLGYRLLITQEVDPICDNLQIFSFKSDELRSQFIEALTNLEDKHPEQLELARHELDSHFKSFLNQLEQMQAVEKANKKSRKFIKNLGDSSKIDFFQDIAEEAQQKAIRAIGDSIRELKSLPSMLEKIDFVKQEYRNKIKELLDVEHRYLNLYKKAIKNINTDIKFSIQSLNLDVNHIESLFIPESSYRFFSGQLKNYDSDANQDVLNKLSSDGMLLDIGQLGDSKEEAINVEVNLSIETLYEQLYCKIEQYRISSMVGFIPVLIDKAEKIDIPAILFYCRDFNEARPELTALLEVLQQGKLIYIRKFITISPLPSHTLNVLLEGYKAAFRSNSHQVKQLITDDFLANKLKLDFHGRMAKVMTEAKQKVKNAYMEELKQNVLKMKTSGSLEQSVFLQTVDNLIIEALDAWIGFEENDEPQLW